MANHNHMPNLISQSLAGFENSSIGSGLVQRKITNGTASKLGNKADLMKRKQTSTPYYPGLLDSKNVDSAGGKSEMDYMIVKNHLNTYSEKKGRTTKL